MTADSAGSAATVVLRRAGPGDVPEVAIVERACFPEDPWGEASLGAELGRAGSVFLVALGPGSVPVGYALGWCVLGELEVLRIGVSPTARRGGLGRRLLVALQQEARAELSFLEVRADNVAALALYASLGYSPIRRRPRYYADGGDALMMRLRL